MVAEVITQIVINAPASRVWEQLMNFSAYSHWNPVLRRVEGVAAKGEHLRVHFHLPGLPPRILRRRIQRLRAGREMIWVGHLWRPGLLSGTHTFFVEPLAGEKTQFVQRHAFSGVLVAMLWPLLHTRTRRGFLLMNAALKEVVERE